MLTGKCLCGAVRYEAREAPVHAFHCYCATCRRESGAGHLTIISFRESAVTISGALTMIAPPRAEGADPIPRYFCPSCGTTMFAKPTGDHGFINIRAGTLDGIVDLKIDGSEFPTHAQPWDKPASTG